MPMEAGVPIVPTICGKCGNVFSSGILIADGARDITLTNNRTKCPKCGAMVAIPDGVYNAVGDALEIIVGIGDAQASIDAINRMRGIFGSNPNAEPEEVFSEMGKTTSAALARAAPKDPEQKRIWMAALLGALLFAWEKLPDGALKWLELAGKAKELFGQSGP